MYNTILLIAVAALVTCGLRALPFIVFSGDRAMPPFIKKVADLLPAAIMAVLVIYCIKGDIVDFSMGTVATGISVIAVILLHLWKRNILLSIFGGTAVYMTLIHLLTGLL